jgi:trehalose-6-phosphate synthase
MWRPFFSELAVSLLQNDLLGFHFEQNSENFLSFLDPTIRGIAQQKIAVAPIALDAEMWQCRAAEARAALSSKLLPKSNFIVSVDRVDYTKGIMHRLDAIDLFFQRNPSFAGSLQFVQVSARSRAGLTGYDRYWAQCREREEQINSRWQVGDWTPIVWIDEPLSQSELALLYSRADALLVTSLKDGLNLTAKEFAMCQTQNLGQVILSTEAGVWQELKDFAITIDPYSADSVVRGIENSIQMSETERRSRSLGLRKIVKASTALDWFRRFEIRDENQRESSILEMFPAAKGKTS